MRARNFTDIPINYTMHYKYNINKVNRNQILLNDCLVVLSKLSSCVAGPVILLL